MTAEPENWNMQYLRVIGRLYPDGRLKLRPCYLLDRNPLPDRERVVDGPLLAELLDESGSLIVRQPLRVYNTCGFGGRPETQAVRGWVPFHPQTHLVRFTYRGRTIQEVKRSEASPEVTLTWRPPKRLARRQRVTWKARHAQDEPLQFFLRYSHNGGKSWHRVGWRSERMEAEVDFETLPGGDTCLLGVVATDGINTTIAQSRPFSVSVKPCQAFVTSPVDGSVFRRGELVELMGNGFYLEEAEVEREALVWTSSADGVLGHGRIFRIASLTPGEHSITLIAGREPRQGSETVTIRVEKDGPASRTQAR